MLGSFVIGVFAASSTLSLSTDKSLAVLPSAHSWQTNLEWQLGEALGAGWWMHGRLSLDGMHVHDCFLHKESAMHKSSMLYPPLSSPLPMLSSQAFGLATAAHSPPSRHGW
jgi:hypothetical protein